MFLNEKYTASKEYSTHLWDAIRGPFVDEYGKAACDEIETLCKMGYWDMIDRTDEMSVIDSTWDLS